MLSLGIDCAQLTHSFCLMEESGRILLEGEFPETRPGLAQFRRAVEAYGEPGAVIMEASGVYWLNLHVELRTWGWRPTAVEPLRAWRFAQLQAPRHKTDKADARSLARLGLQPQRPSLPPSLAKLLAHALDSALKQRTVLINQLHALLVVANPALIVCGWSLEAKRTLEVLRAYPTTPQLRRAKRLARISFGPRHRVGEKEAARLQAASQEALCGALEAISAQQIGFLVAQIGAWNEQIAFLEARLAALQPEAQRLTSIPGVGMRTALIVSACVPLETLASAKQAVAQVGLHPHRFQSNTRVWTRLSKQGDAVARSALCRAAFAAIQSNPRLAAFYQRVRANGKGHRQALCAVAHKLIRYCYALVKYQTLYLPNYLPERA